VTLIQPILKEQKIYFHFKGTDKIFEETLGINISQAVRFL
jgi:hypothetical protein